MPLLKRLILLNQTMSSFSIGKYQVPDVYKPLLYDDVHFIKLLYGSRSSAKSDFAVLRKLQRCLTMTYFKCLMTRKVSKAVKKSIYDKVRSVAKRHNIDHLFSFNDHLTEITCLENGNRFMPLGTHETLGSSGNAKSVDDPTDALIDEMDELSEEEFKSLMFSIRGAKNGESLEIIGVFNTNKIDEDHWIFKRWFPPTNTFERPDGMHTYVGSTRRNTIILHTNYLMNPFNNPTQIEAFLEEKENDLDYYEVHGLGLIKTVNVSNKALRHYVPGKHVTDSVKPNPNALIYFSWDFNRIPHHTVGAWQFGGYNHDENAYYWHLIKEFCLPDHSITKTAEEINKWLKAIGYMSKEVSIVCDYSGRTKRDHDSITDTNKVKQGLKKGGYEPIDRSIVNPSITASLGFLDGIFEETVMMGPYCAHPESTLKIRINPSCKFYCDDFKKSKTTKEGKILKVKKTDTFIEDGVPVKRSYEARGHAIDNSRYLFCSVFEAEYQRYKSQFID